MTETKELSFIVPKVISAKNYDLTPVLHLLTTLQVANDEMDVIKDSFRYAPFKHQLKKDTNVFLKALERYRGQLKEANKILESIWTNVPDEDFNNFNEAKRRLIQRMAFAKFEEIQEMEALLNDALYRMEQLDTFELMLNTHVPSKELRDSYRAKLHYTEPEYKELKRFQNQQSLAT